MATTRRILKKVASLLGKERTSSPTSPKHDVEDTAAEPLRVGNSATKGIAPESEATEFFFARVPPSVTHEELLAVFEKFGAVEDLNLFRPFAEARISKGCGIVRFASSTAAAAARAELHDKHTWTPDYAPMVLERVNEKKKRSNISNGGTNELIFTPKFLTKTKESASTQQPRISRGGSCSSLPPGPDLQRHMSQSSSCSTASAEGPARYFSNSSMGSFAGGKDCARMQDRACGLTGNGYMSQFAVDTINSADCNVVSSGSLLQAANAAVGRPGQGAGQVCSGSNLGLVNSGQLFAPEGPRRGSFEQQRQQQQQQLAFSMEAASRNAIAGQQQTLQVWLQQWQMAGRPHAPALDEGCAGAAGAGAYLPSFRPLQGSDAPAQAGALSAAAAYAAFQPTSLSILAGGQQEQLGVQLPVGGMHNFASSGPSVVPMHGRGVLGSAMNPAAFEGLSMDPALAAAGNGMGLPSLPSAFGNNNECFSTYSNFMDGHPSMQLAAVSASGHIASLSAAANCVADAAAADCSASLLASGAFASGAYASGAVLGAAMQQQQLQQQQQAQAQAQAQNHAGGLASGSNLQLTNGALYRAAGIWDGAEDLAELQKQRLMHLEGDWPAAACDSGYFDLYRSGSSLDSMKGDDTAGTGNSSCSYPNKLSSCSSTDTRHNINTQAAAAALARQQQEQLLTLQEQRKIQLVGLSAGVQPGLQQTVALGGGANSNGFARAGNGLQGQQWQLPPPPPPPQRQQQSLGQHPMSGSLFQGEDLSGSGSVLPLGGSSCKAENETITLDVPTNSAGVSAVAVHIDSIRSMSGAVMAIVPQSGGQLSFKLLGLPNQVQMAFGFIQVLLQKAEPC